MQREETADTEASRHRERDRHREKEGKKEKKKENSHQEDSDRRKEKKEKKEHKEKKEKKEKKERKEPKEKKEKKEKHEKKQKDKPKSEQSTHSDSTPALKADVPSAPIAADSGDKRKLMWQGKSEAEKQLGKWSAADFGGDETRKNKFLALMGGKKYQADTAAAATAAPVQVTQQSVVLAELERQYEQGRAGNARRHGGLGLGFRS